MEPLTLVIDTACSWICIGVFNSKIRSERAIHAPRDSFNNLVPEIKSLLAGRKPSCIVCITGPGSFTGIRIGVSCSRNLAQLWGIPAAGISSLSAAAFAVSEIESGPFAVCIDGKQKRFYTSVVERAADRTRAEFARYLTTLPVRDLTVEEISSLGLPVYADTDAPGISGILRTSPRPDASQHFALFELSGAQAGSFQELIPYYHRLDPAEQKFPGGIHKT